MRETFTRSDGTTVDLTEQQAETLPLLTQKMQNTSNGQPLYIGEAIPGTATSEAKWRIKKMEYDNGQTQPPTGVTWADGVSTFTKEWDERTSYTYS